MQPKNMKTYLPQTYDQFLAQRKKTMKGAPAHTLKILQPAPPPPAAASSFSEAEVVGGAIIKERILHSQYQKMFDEFKDNKFELIRGRIEQELSHLKEHCPIEVTPVSKILNRLEIQSLENIEALKKELQAPVGKRNLQKLEEMLSFNKFFVILNKDKKWKILDQCRIQEYSAGETIYGQGELDDSMYVIVKGCVKQYEKKTTSFNEKIFVNFVSHYEGSNFGELQVSSKSDKPGKRYHYVEATQKCTLLKIDNLFYKELMSNSNEDDFEKKLNALMESAIFKETSKMLVSPLMSTLQKHVLPYGKVLIKQGEEVRRLYFVAEGTLEVMLLDRAKRSIKHLNIEEKPENFYVNRPKTREKPRSKNHSIHNTFYYPEGSQVSKEFIYGQKKLVGDQLQYNDQVIFGEMRVGDFFGGKSFLSLIERQKKEQCSKYFTTSLKAKLSVLSSSTQTTVYGLDEKKFFSLSDNLQKLIIQGLVDNPYFDEFNIEEKAQGKREWRKYAQKMVESVIRSKKDRTQSFRQ